MAPINLPDGSEVSEVILPDGATASEVIAPDGSTVFRGIPDSVFIQNLVAWYRMEGNANDETVNQPNSADTTDFGGTVNGGSFVSSAVTDVLTETTGQAYESTGNEYIQYPYTTPPAFNTITAWVLIIDKSDDFQIFSNFNSTGSDFTFLFTDGSNGIFCAIDNGGSVGFPNPDTGEWYHVAVTITTSDLELFIDGLSVNSDTHSLGSIDNGRQYRTAKPPAVGFDGNGRVDDLRLYDRVLSQPEIKSIYDDSKPPSKP